MVNIDNTTIRVIGFILLLFIIITFDVGLMVFDLYLNAKDILYDNPRIFFYSLMLVVTYPYYILGIYAQFITKYTIHIACIVIITQAIICTFNSLCSKLCISNLRPEITVCKFIILLSFLKIAFYSWFTSFSKSLFNR